MKRLIAIGMGIASILVIFVAATPQRQDKLSDERIASFEMTWKLATPEIIQSRTQAAVEAMTGQPLKRPPSISPLKSSEGVQDRTKVKLAEAPQFDIEYLREYDELRIVDTELSVSTAPKAEISQGEALSAARKVFDELATRKLIDPRHYTWDKVDIASTLVGGGSSDGEKTEKQRIEYRFTIRRVLNGIELANAGIRIAVHASGRISSLRLGGVSVNSSVGTDGVEQPTGNGRWLIRSAIGDPQARFERGFTPKEAKPKVAWARVMYVMPEDKRTAIVEPLYVISYSLEFPTKEGYTVVSRRQTVGVSLVDPKAAPINLTPPVRTPTTEKTRKEYRGP